MQNVWRKWKAPENHATERDHDKKTTRLRQWYEYFKRAGKKYRRDLFDMENMSLFPMRCHSNTRTLENATLRIGFHFSRYIVHRTDSFYEIECSQPILLLSGGDSEVVYYISLSIKSTELILKNCGHRFIYNSCHQHGYRSRSMRGRKFVPLAWWNVWYVPRKWDALADGARSRTFVNVHAERYRPIDLMLSGLLEMQSLFIPINYAWIVSASTGFGKGQLIENSRPANQNLIGKKNSVRLSRSVKCTWARRFSMDDTCGSATVTIDKVQGKNHYFAMKL